MRAAFGLCELRVALVCDTKLDDVSIDGRNPILVFVVRFFEFVSFKCPDESLEERCVMIKAVGLVVVDC